MFAEKHKYTKLYKIVYSSRFVRNLNIQENVNIENLPELSAEFSEVRSAGILPEFACVEFGRNFVYEVGRKTS